MKKNFTLSLLCTFIILVNNLHAQTIKSVESRCINTGKIIINGIIGAGGPYQDSIISSPSQYVNTGLHYTASLPDTFEALFPGTYSIKVIDQSGAVFTYPNIVVQGNYVLPGSGDYSPTTSATTNCVSPNGSIQGVLTNGRAPYTYTILSGPAQVNASNPTGTFANLPDGNYQVQAADSCQNIQTRNVTVSKSIQRLTLSNPVINKNSCTNFTLSSLTVSPSMPAGAHYEIIDYDRSGGSVVAATGTTLPLTFSTFRSDDITAGWVQIHVVDACGNVYGVQPGTVASDWTFTSANVTESCAGGVVLNAVTTSGTIATPFTTMVSTGSTPGMGAFQLASGLGQTVSGYPDTITGVTAKTNPLYVAVGITDACGTQKIVTNNLSFTISAATLKFNNDCSTAKMSITPSGVFASPVTYALSPDPGIGSNTTGNFDNIPDGTYTVTATDACGKVATYNLGNAISHWWGLSLYTGNSCNVGTYYHQFNVPGKAIGTVTYTQYAGGKPITASSTVLSTQTATAPGIPSTDYSGAASYIMFYNTLAGQTYSYVVTDACGYSDTASVKNGNTGHQPTMHATTVKNKCINKGDIIGSWNDDGIYYNKLTVQIWNINNASNLLLNYATGANSNTASYPNGQTLLTDQPPGTYVVKYLLSFCTNNVYYDTVTVSTYVQPTVSTIQSFAPCGGGGTPVIVGASGGVGPYTYQLMGTTPDNYTSTAQTNPVFTLPNSQSTGTVRVLDACLNSTTKTVAITKATAPIVRPNIASLSACSLPLSFNLKVDSLYTGSVFSWTKITGTNAGSTVLSTRPTLAIVYTSIADTATYQVNVTVPNTCYNVTSTFDVRNVMITCSPVISGNVFDDANGLTDNTVNGAPTNAGGLNAILVDGNNQVIATSPVASNGTYSFFNIPQGNYSVVLSTSSGAVGSPAPAPSLPTGWINTGENIGSAAGNDGTVNGILTNITVGTTSVTNLNFGIELPPTAKDVSSAPQTNPGGTKKVTVPTLNGTDPEDGTYDGLSNINTIIINSLPTNGTIYYNNVAVILGQTITNYNPSLLTLDPNDGAITVTFTYTEVDAAGIPSAPATVTMPFTIISTLPIELIDFEALAAGKTSKLTWQVTAQSNVRKFEVQTSTDIASSFQTIGTVNAQSNNSEATNYSWIDQAPSPGVNYYRLKMTDTYGVVTYSPVRSVRFDAANGKGLNIYPVPAVTVVQIELPVTPEAGLIVQLYDDQDKLVNSIPLNQRKTLSLNVQSLSSGVYIVKVMKNTITVYTGRMIKL